MLKLTMMQSGVVNTVLILLKRFIFYFMWLLSTFMEWNVIKIHIS